MSIKVKDRNLRFNYSYGEVEGRFTISLNFEFMEEKQQDEAEENYEMMKTVNINKRKE